jgi:integrase
MARRNRPKHGTLQKNGGRYYYFVQLPGDTKRRRYALRPAGQKFSTPDRREAVALADVLYEQTETKAKREAADSDYDGTLPNLKEIYLCDHKKEIFNKSDRVQKKEMRFCRAAINDLIAFLEGVPFSLIARELKPNRIILWRKHLHFEKKLCRTTINKKVNVIKQMLNHAALHELEPAQLHYEINALKPIKKGQDSFFDYPEVDPVDWTEVEKLRPYLPDMVYDMLQLMRLTGARPGEIRVVRPCDINRSDPDAWIYTPHIHKTQRYGIARPIIINVEAQQILRKYLFRGDVYCFPPQSNHHRDEHDHYTAGSFSRLINRAVNLYNAEHEKQPVAFHANQLRHAFATAVCLQYGLEVTRCALGHRTTQMTKRYARAALEIEQLKNAKIAAQNPAQKTG